MILWNNRPFIQVSGLYKRFDNKCIILTQKIGEM